MAAPQPSVPLLEIDECDPTAVAAYQHVADVRGHMPNVFKALAHSPGVLATVPALGEYLRFGTTLDSSLRELVIITVAAELSCRYEWAHHHRLATATGVDPRLLATVGTDAIEAEPPPLGPALRLARQIARGRPDEDVVDGLAGQLGHAQLVDLVTLASFYVMVARIVDTLRIPIDAGVDAPAMPA